LETVACDPVDQVDGNTCCNLRIRHTHLEFCPGLFDRLWLKTVIVTALQRLSTD
jgi:hypothetical protein